MPRLVLGRRIGPSCWSSRFGILQRSSFLFLVILPGPGFGTSTAAFLIALAVTTAGLSRIRTRICDRNSTMHLHSLLQQSRCISSLSLLQQLFTNPNTRLACFNTARMVPAKILSRDRIEDFCTEVKRFLQFGFGEGVSYV
jgi:hypothetical protein